jgi:hypothetical protein
MAALGATNLSQSMPNFLQVAVSNGGFAVGCAPVRWTGSQVTSFQYADDVDVMRGKHQIAFGVDFLRTRELQ